MERAFLVRYPDITTRGPIDLESSKLPSAISTGSICFATLVLIVPYGMALLLSVFNYMRTIFNSVLTRTR